MPLDAEIAAYLETQKHEAPRSALDIAATRERLRQGAGLAGAPPVLPRVENLVLGGYLRARQYWPATGRALPLVVYFHGGRFISGDLDSHDPICRMLALAAECRVLAVEYRLAPEHRFPAAAGLATGKRVTCYQHVRREAELAGATFIDQEAVCDGRIVTAQTWQSHPLFYREIVVRLRGQPDAARR